MNTSEFDIIKEYFTPSESNPELVSVGIGDDAAVINTNPDEQLVISIDTLNIGVHFPEQSSAYDIGYKALAVNLSDLAAMGAQPKWFTLAISLPSVNKNWLKEFSQGMLGLAGMHKLSLVGGDTTKGPLSITIQIAGTVPVGKGLHRNGAKAGDDIYVTGTLGDAAAALALCQKQYKTSNVIADKLLHSLNQPTPRVDVGLALRDKANACIDISDGFAADLGHILEMSNVGAEIDTENLPVSEEVTGLDIDPEIKKTFILHGGDDYELCFTAPMQAKNDIEEIATNLACKITCVGKIIQEPGLFEVHDDQQSKLDAKGFDHFK